MKLIVHVKPNSHADAVEPIDATHLTVRVRAKPREGKANEAVIRAIAEHLHIAPSRIIITNGVRSKVKTITIIN